MRLLCHDTLRVFNQESQYWLNEKIVCRDGHELNSGGLQNSKNLAHSPIICPNIICYSPKHIFKFRCTAFNVATGTLPSDLALRACQSIVCN